MTDPQTQPRFWNVTPHASLFIRLVAIAAAIAMIIAGFLCLAGLTVDRVVTGLIAGAVALICLIIV